MGTTRRQAALGLTFWSLAAILFGILFFTGGGPSAFGEDSGRVLLTSVAYGTAFIAQFVLVVRYRARRRGGIVVKDEWDDEVGRRAGEAALVVLLIFVYATGIALWESYRTDLVAPIGWFWFIAYGSAMVGFIAHAGATLIIDSSRSRDA